MIKASVPRFFPNISSLKTLFFFQTEDEGNHGNDDTRCFILSTLASQGRSKVHCVLCEERMPVFDRYPLVDGTFFLSPRQHAKGCIEVSYEARGPLVMQLFIFFSFVFAGESRRTHPVLDSSVHGLPGRRKWTRYNLQVLQPEMGRIFSGLGYHVLVRYFCCHAVLHRTHKVQCVLQAGPASRPTPQFLQRLQSHSAVSSLPQFRHALRETSGVLLHPPADTVTAVVAIARGPRLAREGTADASDATSGSHGLGLGVAVARIGRPAPRRVLPSSAHQSPVDGLSFLCYVVAFYIAFIFGGRFQNARSEVTPRHMSHIKTVMLLVYY
jgi:hypothetical protein